MKEPFISDGKIHHGRTIDERNAEIEAIELTEPEIKYALWIGKQHKWYRERNAAYWQEKESNKPSGSSW